VKVGVAGVAVDGVPDPVQVAVGGDRVPDGDHVVVGVQVRLLVRERETSDDPVDVPVVDQVGVWVKLNVGL